MRTYIYSCWAFIFVFLAIQTPQDAAAQKELSYRMLPVCGQGMNVKKFFENQLRGIIEENTDAIIAVHMKLATCPRCEGIALECASRLQRLQFKTILILDEPKKLVAVQYVSNSLSKLDFRPDYIIYDTLGAFRQLIDYDRTNLEVPFIYKISLKNGNFYNIIPSLGLNINKALIDSVVQAVNIMQCTTTKTTSLNIENKFNEIWDSAVVLENAADSGMTNVHSISYFCHTLSILDGRNNTIFCFNTKERKPMFRIAPQDDEYFWSLKDSIGVNRIINLKNQGIARVIYLRHFLEDNVLKVVASIPQIEVSTVGGDTNIGYYNLPVLIEKSMTSRNIRWNEIILSKGGYHSSYTAIGTTGFYVVGTSKGFPAVGTEFNPDDTANNPFLPGFYNHTPTFKLYKKGRLIHDLGSLPEYYKEKKLGYYYSAFLPAYNSKLVFIVSQSTGEVYVYPLRSIKYTNLTFYRGNLMPDKKLDYHSDLGEDKLGYIQRYRSQMYDYYINSVFATKKYLYACLIDKPANRLTIRKYKIDDRFTVVKEKTLQATDVKAIKKTVFYRENGKVYFGGVENSGADYKWGTLQVD